MKPESSAGASPAGTAARRLRLAAVLQLGATLGGMMLLGAMLLAASEA
jgi:hypothetical protein